MRLGEIRSGEAVLHGERLEVYGRPIVRVKIPEGAAHLGLEADYVR
jgi:hypothetical protein